jgi:hypothetical protein
MDKLQKILREYLNKGSERIDVTMVLALIQQCKKDTKEQLTLTDVVSSACICEDNAKGKAISGWCSKHNTDWM